MPRAPRGHGLGVPRVVRGSGRTARTPPRVPTRTARLRVARAPISGASPPVTRRTSRSAVGRSRARPARLTPSPPRTARDGRGGPISASGASRGMPGRPPAPTEAAINGTATSRGPTPASAPAPLTAPSIIRRAPARGAPPVTSPAGTSATDRIGGAAPASALTGSAGTPLGTTRQGRSEAISTQPLAPRGGVARTAAPSRPV